MKWARRQDSNHAKIAEAFVRAGLDVVDVSRAPTLGFDLLVWRGDRFRLIEVKDGAKVPSRRSLTPSESRMWLLHRAVWRMVSTEAEALEVVRELGGQDARRPRSGTRRPQEASGGRNATTGAPSGS